MEDEDEWDAVFSVLERAGLLDSSPPPDAPPLTAEERAAIDAAMRIIDALFGDEE